MSNSYTTLNDEDIQIDLDSNTYAEDTDESSHRETSISQLFQNVKTKFVLLFFAANTSKSCHSFIPFLNKAAEKWKINDEPIEIVLVPQDHNVTQFHMFLSELYSTIKTIEYHGITRKVKAEQYKIETLPTILVLQRETGLELSRSGCEDIEKHGSEAIEKVWLPNVQ